MTNLRTTQTSSPGIAERVQSDHFLSLDGLRGVAVLIVLFIHFGLNHYLHFVHARLDSRFGVDIFFVLSGFLITTNLLREKLKKGTIHLGNFYLRRAFRIIPLVYLYLMVLIILSVVYRPMSSKADFIYSFLFLKNLPIPNQRFTAHLWTLAVEGQFYLVFPLLLSWLGLNRTLRLSLITVVVLPLLSITYTYGDLSGLNHGIDMVMKGINYFFWKGPTILLIGSIAAIINFKGMINLRRLGNKPFLSLLLFLAALLLNIKDTFLYKPYLSQYLSAALIASVILLNIKSDNFLSRIYSSPLLVKTGMLSFSIYIWQQLFIGGGFWIPGLRSFNYLPVCGIMLIKLGFIYLLSTVSYYFYEKRFLKLKEKWH